jgi:tetratricopeptide (TPR) repeat protein
MRPGARAGFILAVVAAVGWAAWLAFREWRAAALLEAGKAAMARGDFASACADFGGMLSYRPDDDEAACLLGSCEQGRGRLDAAMKAWGRVRPDSPFAGLAAARIAPILLERGQYTRAEGLLRKAVADVGPHAAEAREMLARALRLEDRRDEAREVLRVELRLASDPVRVLRDLWLLDFEALALERTRLLFEEAARNTPVDDRVWLALANLDRRASLLVDAETRLRKCLAARPDDPVVWRAWLLWARDAGSTDEVRRALVHLPSRRFTEAEVRELRAWLARQSGNPGAERRELEALAEIDPAAPGALERLAEIDIREGRTDRAAHRRRKKAELDDARERYHRLFEEPDDRLPPHATEMARLAETLGRNDEAKGWWSLRLRSHPGDDQAREALAHLDRDATTTHANGGATLAELAADLAPSATAPKSAFIATPPSFSADSEAAGLRFVFEHGPTPDHFLPETMAGGVGVLDYDGDGLLDVYCVQGGPIVPQPGRTFPGDRLFRNRGDGTFEDVTERAGIAAMPRGYGHGVAVGDIDNDGCPDLFVTRLGSYALYRNRGDGTYEDRTEAAGLGGDRGWPTSAAFADLDGDGDVDLYVCHYVHWNSSHPARCHDPETKRPNYCQPRAFEAEPDRLFRNDGGRFVDVSAEAGIDDRDGRGLGVVAVDLDGDARLDLFVANDTTANLVFFNRGGLTFREAGLESGLAANAAGGFLAGMGVACGDADGDGRPDLAVTNFYDESTTLYVNLGHGFFADTSSASGIAAPSRYLLGFGISFLDYDNDGHTDLATANGHVNDSRPLYPYAMPVLLLAGGESGRFVDVSTAAGRPLTTPRVGRGLTAGDLDNDGKVDLLIVSQGGPLAYLHNRTAGGHFLVLRLEGTRSSRDAVGARVVVTSAGRHQSAWRFGGGSYLSASDQRLHFGLGVHDRAESVDVYWPSGHTDHYRNLKADAGYLLREGQPAPHPLFGPESAGVRRAEGPHTDHRGEVVHVLLTEEHRE